tara:strand:+ start:830 stop:1006 length:177 start_codon:yes stop_codon:yes gene_type:complete
MVEQTYEEMKDELEALGFNSAAIEARLARWLEANPDKAPKAKKEAKKVAKKEEKKKEE